MSLPSRACKSSKSSSLELSHAAKCGGFGIGAGCGNASGIYLGEDGGPDGLDFLDLGGTEEGLDLVGLNEDSRSVTYSKFRVVVADPSGFAVACCVPPKTHFPHKK
jgi:hypothetical protein